MGIGKVSSLAAASLAKVNTIAKASINKINAVTASFAAAFTNAQAVSKSTSTGSSNAITFTDTDDTFNFTSSDAWTISFWIKAGWSSSLNTNIHLIIGQKASATYQLSDMVKILYNESNNRLECRYGNKTTSSDA